MLCKRCWSAATLGKIVRVSIMSLSFGNERMVEVSVETWPKGIDGLARGCNV